MTQFRKKPVVIEATQWFKHGDHPAVTPLNAYRAKVRPGWGWIQTLEGGHEVTPGDWIITGVKGEHYPCKPGIFALTYEPSDAAQQERRPMNQSEIEAAYERSQQQHLRGQDFNRVCDMVRAVEAFHGIKTP